MPDGLKREMGRREASNSDTPASTKRGSQELKGSHKLERTTKLTQLMAACGIEMVEQGFEKDTGHRKGSWKRCYAGEMRSQRTVGRRWRTRQNHVGRRWRTRWRTRRNHGPQRTEFTDSPRSEVSKLAERMLSCKQTDNRWQARVCRLTTKWAGPAGSGTCQQRHWPSGPSRPSLPSQTVLESMTAWRQGQL